MYKPDELTSLSLVAGALAVNARYSAFNFYQSREGSPLTLKEMEEITTGVLNDIGTSARQMAESLTESANSD